MSSSSDRETPKKSVKGRPRKENSCNDFCRVCRCNFKCFYGDFKRRVSTENLFEISKRAGVKKCRLADLVTELGFSCEKNLAASDRVCAKCATKIRNASELMRYLKSGFLAPQEQPKHNQNNNTTSEYMSFITNGTNTSIDTRSQYITGKLYLNKCKRISSF